MSNATVDALGMCLATSLYWYGLLRQAISLISVWGKCTHIGVGFDVARSTILGNAKASISGTSNEEIPRFPFNLCLFLWDFRSEQERNKYEYIRTSKETFARCHQPRG